MSGWSYERQRPAVVETVRIAGTGRPRRLTPRSGRTTMFRKANQELHE